MNKLKLAFVSIIGSVICSNVWADDAASKLNLDWNNINRTGCKTDDPDYYCSGVIAHIFDNDSLKKLSQQTSNSFSTGPWMPNAEGIKKGSVSFSYLRRDLPVSSPLYVSSNPAGYIFQPINSLTTGRNLKEYTLFCDYPLNSDSDDRTNKGCGFRPNTSITTFGGEDLSTCNSIGINTPEAYENAILNSTWNMCSAGPDKVGFNMMLNTIKLLLTKRKDHWNELVIQEWSNKKNEDVPIAAFFYEVQHGVTAGKESADSAAKLYRQVTNLDVPVVGVDVDRLEHGDPTPFFNEKFQAKTKS